MSKFVFYLSLGSRFAMVRVPIRVFDVILLLRRGQTAVGAAKRGDSARVMKGTTRAGHLLLRLLPMTRRRWMVMRCTKTGAVLHQTTLAVRRPGIGSSKPVKTLLLGWLLLLRLEAGQLDGLFPASGAARDELHFI